MRACENCWAESNRMWPLIAFACEHLVCVACAGEVGDGCPICGERNDVWEPHYEDQESVSLGALREKYK